MCNRAPQHACDAAACCLPLPVDPAGKPLFNIDTRTTVPPCVSLPCSAAGALPLSAAEVLLPLQSCVALLGPRLKDAALGGILQLCVQAMGRR
jgi:hypothetical protein